MHTCLTHTIAVVFAAFVASVVAVAIDDRHLCDTQGTEGKYLDSLFDTYSLPAGWFTEANEKIHGRLAMLGLGSLFLMELLKGTAVL